MSAQDHPGKRRKLGHNGEQPLTSKYFAAIPGGRDWTLSVALPGSVVTDWRTADQRMTSPGRIARALAVFGVDEVVVYDDMAGAPAAPPPEDPNGGKNKKQGRQQGYNSKSQHSNDSESSLTVDVDPCHFLTHLLSYLEAPPFMRKALFPIHPNLRLAGLLPTMDMPHHPNPIDTPIAYREGVTIEGMPPSGKGTLVDIGTKGHVAVDDEIPPKTRITLHLPQGDHGPAEAVNPAAPREEGGFYWGYNVRKASSLSAIFEECPHEGGYDVSIGTSDRGETVAKVFPDQRRPLRFKHMLVVFGGPKGIEFAASNDAKLAEMGIYGSGTSELFDHWLNVLPGQGSRVVRTDEAMYIALSGLRRLWDSN